MMKHSFKEIRNGRVHTTRCNSVEPHERSQETRKDGGTIPDEALTEATIIIDALSDEDLEEIILQAEALDEEEDEDMPDYPVEPSDEDESDTVDE